MKREKRETCSTCRGAVYVRCPECGGNGTVPVHAATPLLERDADHEQDVHEARVLMRLEAA